MKRNHIYLLYLLIFLLISGCSWRELGLFYGKHLLEKQLSSRAVGEKISLIITDSNNPETKGVLEFKGLYESETLLKQLIKEKKPLVVFIHGKGKLDVKGLDPRVIWRIEKAFSVKVLVFHWPSYDPGGYKIWPQQNAQASAPYLIRFLKILQDFNIRKQIDPPVTLLFHSMGARVLMYALRGKEESTSCDQNGLDFSQIADRVLLSAPEVPSKHHEKWVHCVNTDTWITYNGGDMMLAAVEAFRLSPRLGNDVENINKKPSGKGLNYLNFTSLEGGDHEYALGQSTKATRAYFKLFYHGKIEK